MGSDVKKDTNPKDAVGIAKAPLTVIPQTLLGELGVALLEGARKYGRHNWRVAGVRASVYIDAAWRHLADWWEGEDIDPDSDLNHITKAIASLTVLRDAMIQDSWVDDRPPPTKKGWLKELNARAKRVLEKYPDAVDPYTHQHTTRMSVGSVKCLQCMGDRVYVDGSRDLTHPQDTCTCEEMIIETVQHPTCELETCYMRVGRVGERCHIHGAE